MSLRIISHGIKALIDCPSLNLERHENITYFPSSPTLKWILGENEDKISAQN